MHTNTFAEDVIKELEVEASATRKCLERIEEKHFAYKPHEKSMPMGYLSVIVAEVPKWIAATIEKGEIDFATWERFDLKTTAGLVEYFDKNMESAKKALSGMSEEALGEFFSLKMSGKELMKDTKKDSISGSVRHWIHHRGQLTVYMRLNEIAVPSIYGPSADENTFQ